MIEEIKNSEEFENEIKSNAIVFADFYATWCMPCKMMSGIIDEIAKERILAQIDGENFREMKYLKEEYNQFKSLCVGKIPYMLLDYIKYDGAPDPVKFIDKEKTYLGFVAKTEKDENLKALLLDNNFEKIVKELNGNLPLKRINEFVIL